MQTYSEFLMIKTAEEGEEETRLKDYAAKRDAGDEQVVNALNTMSPGELGWGALGAGVGAGGGYLLSRWLRRNGTKGQRALDMLLGAIVGGGGTMLLLNTLPGKEGFSPAEQMRLSRMESSNGDNSGVTMDTDTRVPEKPGINWGRVGSVGAGAGLGGVTGYRWGSNIAEKTGLAHRMGRRAQGRRTGASGANAYKSGEFRAKNLLGGLFAIPMSIFGGWGGNKVYDTLSSVKGDVGS